MHYWTAEFIIRSSQPNFLVEVSSVAPCLLDEPPLEESFYAADARRPEEQYSIHVALPDDEEQALETAVLLERAYSLPPHWKIISGTLRQRANTDSSSDFQEY